MLKIVNLHVEVAGQGVLKGINLTIPDHEVHALFGPNGSGKSVLISTIMGYPEYEITEGEILYNGESIKDMRIDERVNLGISALEQRPPTIKGIKIGDLANIILQNSSKNDFKITELIEHFEMDKFLDRNINEGFSGGEIKKSEIFLLIIAQPNFIILDEPDSGVDPEHLRIIGQMINESLNLKRVPGRQFNMGMRKSGLIATHSAAILDYIHTDKAHILVNGKIKCSGNPGIMMDQIKENGYDYCIKCQQNQEEGL
jgi:Fe-S cluster assembly ATP-binding protein